MAQSLPDPLLERFGDFVADQLGLAFPRTRWSELERGIQSAALEFGMTTPESCAQWLMQSPLRRDQIEVLAGALTVGETYFFREKAAFAALSEKILPELIAARRDTDRRLRIWSAGCCTGEEAYSIAILVKRLLPDLDQWRVTVLGTDVNPRFLAKASEGVYGEWSFRDAPPWLKDNYFKRIDARHCQIAPSIRKIVKFSVLNLARDIFPSPHNDTYAIDVIFCRNVLMYFSPESAKRAVMGFRGALNDGGWLVVGATEASSPIFSEFACVQTDGLTLYQKADSPPVAELWGSNQETMRDFRPEGNAETLYSAKSSGGLAIETSVSESLEAGPAPQRLLETASPRYAEALALFDQGLYSEAARKLAADASEPALNADEACLRARICANQGLLDEAAQWSEKALDQDKLSAPRHYFHAVILRERGRDEAAAISFRRALYLDPDFVMAHFALGSLEWRRQRFKPAHRHFANTLALLQRRQDGEVLPHSDGLVAGRLKAMVQSILDSCS